MAKRLKYTKEILTHMLNGTNVPNNAGGEELEWSSIILIITHLSYACKTLKMANIIQRRMGNFTAEVITLSFASIRTPFCFRHACSIIVSWLNPPSIS